MASLVVVLIANGGESASAVPTLVWLLACVDTHVDKQVASLIEILLTPHALKEAVVATSLKELLLLGFIKRAEELVVGQ